MRKVYEDLFSGGNESAFRTANEKHRTFTVTTAKETRTSHYAHEQNDDNHHHTRRAT